ncbi:type II secretion system F family protein [Massilia antarctica]|uniref:type II secretion system F family protein n=1 Tax=Massilia antarctica TaxID=2765360 RepID=UPI0006BB6CED|nr:type II secretion system F family protein [Massilia sp. H27-R4]MCY0914929.1 type II secretion system F family protein [Massilia sp. H27-R4]CUI06894.1 Flp pilus assembly protein TadB [Janthinobacterium sp. CG23_2]CUU30680.1 Flp pilus assembly protein TadB [Janthinobacterium sp. CG23_2]
MLSHVNRIGAGAPVSPLLSVLVFIAVVLLFEGLYLMWKTYKGPQAKKIERRLKALSAAGDSSAQSHLLRARMMSELPPFQRLLLRLPRAHQLDRYLLQANLDWTVSVLLLGCVALGVASFLLVTALLHQPFVLGALVCAALAWLPLVYVQRRRYRRLKKLEQQLPDALDLLARALRAGHAFGAGLQMIGGEMADPIASEFRMVHDEINFGVSLEQALGNLSVRVPITDLRYFVVAVLIQRDSGGNLTEVLTNLSRLIRQRLKLFWHVRVLSAEGRLSAWLLSLLPFAIGALMSVFNPDFMAPLWTDPLGQSLVRGMLISMAFGIMLLRHIIRIRF